MNEERGVTTQPQTLAEDSPEGCPQTPIYEWERQHDEYVSSAP
jgi:hypothetical protein